MTAYPILRALTVGVLLLAPMTLALAEPADLATTHNESQRVYPPASGNFTGQGKWRSLAPLHYYSGSCCYCLEATNARPAATSGETEFLVDGTWWSLPNSVMRAPIDGAKPVEGFYMICDPKQREFACIIPGAAG